MWQPAARWMVALVAAGLVATGCSDDGDALSKEEFVAEAEAICGATRDEIDDRAEGVDINDTAQLDELIVFVAEQVLDQIEDLRALGLPSADAGVLNGALSVYERNAEAWLEDPSVARTGTFGEEFTAAAQTLDAYGLAVCSAEV